MSTGSPINSTISYKRGKDILCLALFRFLLSTLDIIGLSLLLLVIGRC